MDAKLQSVIGNYEVYDADVKVQDINIYQTFFVDQFGQQQLRKQLEGTYEGFSDSDMVKINTWYNTQPNPNGYP